MNAAKSITGIFLAGLMLIASQISYAAVAGNVQFATGTVRAVNATGQTRALRKGDAINESDTVSTEKNSSAQIKMRDGGLIAMRPESELKFDNFVFNGEQDGTEKSFFSLLKGGMRAITGMIGRLRKNNYLVRTQTATIGIRGTDHEIYVVLPGSALAATVPVGTYNKVNTGGTVMTTDKGAIDIGPNQMGFAGAKDQMPQLQPVNLKLFTVAPAPMPQAGGNTGVRAGAVVDSGAIQGQDGNAQGNPAAQNNVKTPIKGTFGGGQTAPQQTVTF